MLAGVLAAGGGTLWAMSPSGSDLQDRVQGQAALRGGTLIQPGEVPPLLAEAIVATEDERFCQHHGIDAIGL